MPFLPRFMAWPVKLPLRVMVIYQGPEHVNTVSAAFSPVRQAVSFYRRQRIILQPQVAGLAMGERPYKKLLNDVWEPMHTQYFHTGGAPFTVLYLLQEADWHGRYLGQAYGGQLAVVAGNQILAGNTLAHELGHLLLSDPPTTDDDHQDGSFMAAQMWPFNHQHVTTGQRTRMHETAYRFGSL